MGHLNAISLQRLLKNPRDEAELYAHLSEGCEECEAFLAQTGELDGLTDAVLLSQVKPAAAQDPRADETFRRIHAGERPSRRWVVALAAMLLAVVALFLLRPRGDEDRGLKGAPKLTVELQAVVKQADGALVRVEAGHAVHAGGTLLIRYHASESGTAKLVLVRGGQREELGIVSLESGTHDLTREGALVGFSLEGEKGPLKVRVETVESAAELDLEVE